VNEGNPLDRLTADVTERARHALMQGLAMHDAATILMATKEFAEWVAVFQNGSRPLQAPDVIQFFMSYAQALITSHLTSEPVNGTLFPEDG
jgi:hypothetical protein